MFLLDTNVVSELRKVKAGKAHHKVAAWNNAVAPNQAFLSVISVLELEIAICQIERRDAAQGAMLKNWMSTQVLAAFADRILAIDSVIAQCCARLHVPNPHSERDALIAATALVHRLTVVTGNVDDFKSTGVAIINPWESQA